MRTLSKNTSLTSWPPSIVWIGRTVTPGDFMSTRKKEMPSCFFTDGVGAREHEDPVGVLGERRPGLLAVDHPAIAVALGAWCAAPRGPIPRPARKSPGTTSRASRRCAAGSAPSAPASRKCRSPARPCWCRRRAIPAHWPRWISSLKIKSLIGLQPVPPHSTGQCGTDQPFAARMRVQRDDVVLARHGAPKRACREWRRAGCRARRRAPRRGTRLPPR